LFSSNNAEENKKRNIRKWQHLNEEELFDYLITRYKNSLLLILLFEYDNHIETEEAFREVTPQRKKLNKLYMNQAKRYIMVSL
jgi:hypothetical protein